MSNFAPVAFLDTWELAASLRTRMGLFDKGEPRILPIRGPRATADDPDDDTGFVFYKAASQWAELKSMLARISRLGDGFGGIEFGRIFLELLPPGDCLPWTLEDSAYNVRFMRAELPLRTNPAAIVYSGPESAHLAPGWLTIINHRARHSAANHGEHPRIHLCLDHRRKEIASA